MKKRIIALTTGLLVLSVFVAGCSGKTNSGANASPSDSAAVSPAASAAVSAAASASPAVSVAPDGFVMGKIKSITDTEIVLTLKNPDGEKTITTDLTTTFAKAGSVKTIARTDLAKGDVITATLKGTLALSIVDDGPNIDPNPSAYVSPSPSAEASPAASK